MIPKIKRDFAQNVRTRFQDSNGRIVDHNASFYENKRENEFDKHIDDMDSKIQRKHSSKQNAYNINYEHVHSLEERKYATPLTDSLSSKTTLSKDSMYSSEPGSISRPPMIEAPIGQLLVKTTSTTDSKHNSKLQPISIQLRQHLEKTTQPSTFEKTSNHVSKDSHNSAMPKSFNEVLNTRVTTPNTSMSVIATNSGILETKLPKSSSSGIPVIKSTVHSTQEDVSRPLGHQCNDADLLLQELYHRMSAPSKHHMATSYPEGIQPEKLTALPMLGKTFHFGWIDH